jgi:hypothetical protein
MALTAQDVTQLQQALDPQFKGIRDSIVTLSDTMKENATNQRNSVQQLFDMDRKQADEIRRIEKEAADAVAKLDKEATERINTTAIALRRETDDKFEKARTESGENVSALKQEIKDDQNKKLVVWGLILTAVGIAAGLVASALIP